MVSDELSTLRFVVEGVPVPKARPRVTKTGRTYTPEKSAAYERLVRHIALSSMQKSGLSLAETSVFVEVVAYMPIPASWPRKKRIGALLGGIRPIVRPDLDNIVKSVLDACNGVVYGDDSQVCTMVLQKRYETEEHRPSVHVSINWMKPQSGP